MSKCNFPFCKKEAKVFTKDFELCVDHGYAFYTLDLIYLPISDTAKESKS